MLYNAETLAVTGRVENILKRHDQRMLRYIAEVKWQNKASREEVVMRYALKKSVIQGCNDSNL